MKITEINIGAFGGVKDFTIKPEDSLNVIYAENEGGKSTVLAFIKAMFYGTGRKQRNEMGAREKYTPWDSGVMGGSICFEHEGVSYRLERQFRSSDSTDHIVLFNLDLGEQQICDKDFATALFGVGMAAFERSLFIGLNPAFTNDTEASGEFDLKLSNAVQTGDESVSLDRVQKRIATAKSKLLSKTGKAGRLAELRGQLEDLKRRHQKSLLDEKERGEKAKIIAELTRETEQLKRESQELERAAATAQNIKNAEKLKEYIAALNQDEQLSKALSMSDGKPLSPAFVNAVSFGLGKISSAANTLNQLNDRKAALEQLLGQINSAHSRDLDAELKDCEDETRALEQKIAHLNTATASPQKSKAFVWFILSGVLAAASIVLLVLSLTVPFIAGAIISAVLFTLGLISKANSNKAALKAEQTRAEIISATALLDAAKQRKESITALITASREDAQKREDSLNEIVEEIGRVTAKAERETEEVLTYFSRYKALTSAHEVQAELEVLKEKLDLKRENDARLSLLNIDFDGLSIEDAKANLLAAENENPHSAVEIGDAEQRIEQLNNILSEKSALLVQKQTELKAEFSGSENPAAVNKARVMCEQAVRSQENFCEECDIALEVLGEAFREMRKSYGGALESKTLSIFSRLTLGRYDAVSVSREFDLAVRNQGDFISRESGYLSQGTQDQLYLSLRLSLADLLSENEPLPVFLDDALSQFDDSRTAAALDYLKNSHPAQSLLFTCHKSVSQSAKDLGANVIDL